MSDTALSLRFSGLFVTLLFGFAVAASSAMAAESEAADVPPEETSQSGYGEMQSFAAGRLAFDVYLDAMPFQTFSRGFLNRSFLLSPTVATTGIGALGAAGRIFVSKQVWLGAQIYDGNAVSGEFAGTQFRKTNT